MRTPADDYRALREDAATLGLDGWGVLLLSGADTGEFLQGTATQDLAQAGPDRAVETLFLNEKGRPVALAWVAIAASGAEAWIVADPGSSAALLPHFERFRIMEDVEFGAAAESPRVAGVAGPNRSARLAALAAATPGSAALPGEPLSFLLLPASIAAPPLPSVAEAGAAEAWRLAVGLPLGGVDFDLERIATELDLPEAISFTKGCYVGQEVVARTSNRGQVRRKRVGFRFLWRPSASAAALSPRTPIVAKGAPAGFVTSTAAVPGTGEGLGMGYLATERLEAGSSDDLAFADAAGDPVPIQIGDWPL